MKRLTVALWLVPLVLAVVLWVAPPRGDDSYYHTVNAVEQLRAWHEGEVFPRYHRGWNGGTGSFAPTIYSPLPLAVQGALAWMAGDGQRAVGLSLVLALMAAGCLLAFGSGRPEAALIVMTPYFLALSLTRATTTEAWALAGAAAVVAFGMPGRSVSRVRGLGLAVAVAMVAGSQIGMLIQLTWILGAAWLVWFTIPDPLRQETMPSRWGRPLRTLAWVLAGMLTAAVGWLPALSDGRHLALDELVTGPFDWRTNFLPGSSDLSVPWTVTAIGLAAVVLITIFRGQGRDRYPLVAAAAMGLFFTVGLSAPLWTLPGMENLQFPWRFLGPTTVVVVVMIRSLQGRWLWAAVVLLVAPGILLPLKLESSGAGVPADASAEKLARVVEDRWGLAPILPSARGFYAPGYHRINSLVDLDRQQPMIVAEKRVAAIGRWRVAPQGAEAVLLPIQWWPEWKIVVDGEEVPYSNQSGLVVFDCPDHPVVVEASLRPSRSRTDAIRVSLAGLLLLVVLWWFGGRRK